MPCKTRFTLTTTAVLTVFILSAMWTVPALADDSAPPPVETPTEAVTPPPAEPAAVEPALTQPAPLTELLEQLPEGTDLVVTDAAGEAVPLAAQEAAQAVTFNDPIWCPDGVTPIANTGGCSPSYLTLEALVADVGTGFIPARNGTIWIEDGPEGSANPIVFNGGAVNFGTWANFSLTLQGGWTTVGKTINSLDPSRLNKQLYILDWNANVTLKDIVLNGAASNVIVDDSALYITTTRNILLDRVTVQNSFNNNPGFEMGGAYLNNFAGAGTVTINNSNFQGNEGDGLMVESAGVIAANNLVASLNGGMGVFMDNSFALTDKAVTMKGLKQFNKNGSDGLVIFSDGLVTLSNIVANNNGGNGVRVNNGTSLTNLGVTVIGTNYFMGNTGGDGLFVLSHGVITANNLNASNNFGTGAYLDNCDLNPDCSVIYAKLVKLSGVNTFSSNGSDGLDILSFGAIYANSLNASGNGGNGAYMDNQWTNNALLPKDSVGTWTLTGCNIFNNNGVNGLLGYSHGNMLLNNLTANDNGDDGLELDAQKFIGSASVTIKGVNTFNNNDFDGLYIFSNGRIALSNITASGNLNRGVDLDNFSGLGITLTGVNNFLNNGETGVYAISSGAITAGNVTASSNQYGAIFENWINSAKPFNVTLTGNNSFNDNDHDGLKVYSYGAILINNLTANDNGWVAPIAGFGAYLDNCDLNGSACAAIVPKTVTLTGSVNVNGNFDDGLYIDSLGAVTMTNVSASGNGQDGVNMENSYNAAKPQNVTLKGSNSFNDNGGSGLVIYSYGAIALNNITANGNGVSGTILDNHISGSSSFARTITLTGVNAFVGNTNNGLNFQSSGSVVLNRVNADMNDGAINAYTGSGMVGTAHTGSITLVCGHTFLNEKYGYDLTALVGPIVIKGIYSYANGSGDSPPAGGLVSITKACALP